VFASGKDRILASVNPQFYPIARQILWVFPPRNR